MSSDPAHDFSTFLWAAKRGKRRLEPDLDLISGGAGDSVGLARLARRFSWTSTMESPGGSDPRIADCQ